MKKRIILLLCTAIFFVGCFSKSPQVISFPEKEAKLVVAIFEKNENEIKKIDEEIKQWEKLANKGNSTAVNEFKEWSLVKQMVDEYHAEVNYKTAKELLKNKK